MGSTSWAAGVMTYGVDSGKRGKKNTAPCNGYSIKRNDNKMETVLLTHLQRVTMLPTGSYDDDDILTEAPRGYSQLHHFVRLQARDFCFGVSSGEI